MLPWTPHQTMTPHEEADAAEGSVRDQAELLREFGVSRLNSRCLAKCRYLEIIGGLMIIIDFAAQRKNIHQSIFLRLTYHKLTWQIQSYIAPDQSKPNLQVLLWRDTPASDNVSHCLGSVTWMYKICRHLGDRMVLLLNISCYIWLP